MDIQTQIEKAVTNGRGYNRAGFETKADFGSGKSETDSDASLQARLTYMEGQSAKKFFGLYSNLFFKDCKELQELDKDLKNLGLKDAVTTPEQVEQALKIKRYLTSLVQTQIEQAYPREQNPADFINFIKKKPSTDEIFMGYIPNLNKILDIPSPRHWKTLETLPEKHRRFGSPKEEKIFYFWDEYNYNPYNLLKKTKR